ncbi:hypothetical protein ACFWVU_07920 [Streptomyces sp. NPDC058686]|uniref:hypothetical protein n=1 Tax=Streptomyces sp. NPDC058686 TaxID=3346599 RepID=UPI0036629DB1
MPQQRAAVGHPEAARRAADRGSSGPVTDQIDLAPCGLTKASQLAGLTVTYTVTAGSGGATEHLGGTRIDLLSGPLVQAAVSFDGHASTVKQWTVLP